MPPLIVQVPPAVRSHTIGSAQTGVNANNEATLSKKTLETDCMFPPGGFRGPLSHFDKLSGLPDSKNMSKAICPAIRNEKASFMFNEGSALQTEGSQIHPFCHTEKLAICDPQINWHGPCVLATEHQ
jgi:hypothetical protein